MVRRFGAGALAVAAMMSFALPATAATYDFTYQGGYYDPKVSGSGTFTTNAENNLIISGSGVFSIGSVSGATSLFPVTAYTAGFNSDNVFPIDSIAGILFEGTRNSSFFANIFAPTGRSLGVGISHAWFSATNGSGYLWGSLGFAPVCTNCVADGTLRISATPLPSTWGMMLLGLGVLGFVGFRRRNTIASNAAA